MNLTRTFRMYRGNAQVFITGLLVADVAFSVGNFTETGGRNTVDVTVGNDLPSGLWPALVDFTQCWLNRTERIKPFFSLTSATIHRILNP